MARKSVSRHHNRQVDRFGLYAIIRLSRETVETRFTTTVERRSAVRTATSQTDTQRFVCPMSDDNKCCFTDVITRPLLKMPPQLA